MKENPVNSYIVFKNGVRLHNAKGCTHNCVHFFIPGNCTLFIENDVKGASPILKYVKIMLQILLLYVFVLVGNWVQLYFHLPLPGSIIGLLLLLAALSLKIVKLNWVESGAYFLLSFLPLYFIPATVGVIDYGYIFTGKGLLLIPLVMASTFLTMWVSGYISQRIARKNAERKERISCKS